MFFLSCIWSPTTCSFSLFQYLGNILLNKFIFSASIHCVRPSFDIRLGITLAIHCDHCAQSLLFCPALTTCDSISKVPQGILSIIIFLFGYRGSANILDSQPLNYVSAKTEQYQTQTKFMEADNYSITIGINFQFINPFVLS